MPRRLKDSHPRDTARLEKALEKAREEEFRKVMRKLADKERRKHTTTPYRRCSHPKPTERYADGSCKQCRKDKYAMKQLCKNDAWYRAIEEGLKAERAARKADKDSGLIGLPKRGKRGGR